MKKQYVMRTVIMALALMLMMSAMVMSASAAETEGPVNFSTASISPDTDSAQQQFGPYTARATLRIEATSATAQTIYGTGCSVIYAEVNLYYIFGENLKAYVTRAITSHEGVSSLATATRKHGGAELTGAQGIHRLISGSITWGQFGSNPDQRPVITEVGKILPNAERV